MKVFVDADILIWHLRGEEKATRFLSDLRANPDYTLHVGAMQRAEVVFFMRVDEEVATLALLSLFETMPVDQGIVDQAGTIYRKWNKSHGTDPNDAILAATILQTGGKLYTLNEKHFPMPDLIAARPW